MEVVGLVEADAAARAEAEVAGGTVDWAVGVGEAERVAGREAAGSSLLEGPAEVAGVALAVAAMVVVERGAGAGVAVARATAVLAGEARVAEESEEEEKEAAVGVGAWGAAVPVLARAEGDMAEAEAAVAEETVAEGTVAGAMERQ